MSFKMKPQNHSHQTVWLALYQIEILSYENAKVSAKKSISLNQKEKKSFPRSSFIFNVRGLIIYAGKEVVSDDFCFYGHYKVMNNMDEPFKK